MEYRKGIMLRHYVEDCDCKGECNYKDKDGDDHIVLKEGMEVDIISKWNDFHGLWYIVRHNDRECAVWDEHIKIINK